MAFYGTRFIFDGVPSETYGLMIYNIDGHNNEDGVVGTTRKIAEDRLPHKYKPIDYGVYTDEPLSFKMTFGVSESNENLDRWDVAKIAGWLKQQDYKYLMICQEDMMQYRYLCRITELHEIQINGKVIGFDAMVICDGPYAYHMPFEVEFDAEADGGQFLVIRNPSNVNDYYYPKLNIATNNSEEIRITNYSDDNRTFILNNLPAASMNIDVDGENGMLSYNASEMQRIGRYYFTVPEDFAYGDINMDGVIDGADAQLIGNHIVENIVLTGDQYLLADIDLSGEVDTGDFAIFPTLLSGSRKPTDIGKTFKGNWEIYDEPGKFRYRVPLSGVKGDHYVRIISGAAQLPDCCIVELHDDELWLISSRMPTAPVSCVIDVFDSQNKNVVGVVDFTVLADIAYGDVNMDTMIDEIDADMISDHTAKNTILSGDQFLLADIDQSGEVDVGDMVCINGLLHGTRKPTDVGKTFKGNWSAIPEYPMFRYEISLPGITPRHTVEIIDRGGYMYEDCYAEASDDKIWIWCSRLPLEDSMCTIKISAGALGSLYECCNFNFVRLLRGENRLLIEGDCHVTFTCEVPMDIGH